MKIITQDEIRDKVHELFKTGGGVTYYAGYKSLARHYSVKEGGVTDWTGYPGSGKSELLLDVLKNCSKWYGHKHLVHMPDAGQPQEVIAKLMHKLSGKSFDEFRYDAEGNRVIIPNRLSQDELDKWLPRVLDWFCVFNPSSSSNASKAVSPRQFWDFAVANKEKLNIFSAVIDSWNYMHHDTTGFSREDKWLESELSYRNELAERSGMHFHTIIHPKTAKKDSEGNVLAPDAHSLKGGSEWNNNGKSIIVAHREFDSNQVSVTVAKAKPAIVGVRGKVNLLFDLAKAGYYEFVDGEKKYAEPLPRPDNLSVGITPNFEF